MKYQRYKNRCGLVLVTSPKGMLATFNTMNPEAPESWSILTKDYVRQDIELPLTSMVTRNRHYFTARPTTEEVAVIVFTSIEGSCDMLPLYIEFLVYFSSLFWFHFTNSVLSLYNTAAYTILYINIFCYDEVGWQANVWVWNIGGNFVKVCQNVSRFTKNLLHSINIWETVTKVLLL